MIATRATVLICCRKLRPGRRKKKVVAVTLRVGAGWLIDSKGMYQQLSATLNKNWLSRSLLEKKERYK